MFGPFRFVCENLSVCKRTATKTEKLQLEKHCIGLYVTLVIYLHLNRTVFKCVVLTSELQSRRCGFEFWIMQEFFMVAVVMRPMLSLL